MEKNVFLDVFEFLLLSKIHFDWGSWRLIGVWMVPLPSFLEGRSPGCMDIWVRGGIADGRCRTRLEEQRLKLVITSIGEGVMKPLRREVVEGVDRRRCRWICRGRFGAFMWNSEIRHKMAKFDHVWHSWSLHPYQKSEECTFFSECRAMIEELPYLVSRL